MPTKTFQGLGVRNDCQPIGGCKGFRRRQQAHLTCDQPRKICSSRKAGSYDVDTKLMRLEIWICNSSRSYDYSNKCQIRSVRNSDSPWSYDPQIGSGLWRLKAWTNSRFDRCRTHTGDEWQVRTVRNPDGLPPGIRPGRCDHAHLHPVG